MVLALLGVTLSHLLPAARAGMDRMAVHSAREEIVGLFHRMRLEAVAHGGAAIVLRTSPPSAHLVVAGDTMAGGRLSVHPGLSMVLSRGRSFAELSFGPLGLGRISSQTIRLRKGTEESLLVVSSLGRVVRR